MFGLAYFCTVRLNQGLLNGNTVNLGLSDIPQLRLLTSAL